MKNTHDMNNLSSIHKLGNNSGKSIDSLNVSKKKISSDSLIADSLLEKEMVCLESTFPCSAYKGDKVGWKQMHSIKFHSSTKPLNKKITLSFLERNGNKITAIGKERTFFLSQFDESKVHDLDVKFQKNFKSTEYATVAIRIQYIKNEEELITNILGKYTTLYNH